ncbi:retention module-containing protein, partial [Oxalobacter sp. OttesenSCG-928-P03]|nr:retention module-containing protein [Oxalobacter sp. OttesenSCG-928-P03]
MYMWESVLAMAGFSGHVAPQITQGSGTRQNHPVRGTGSAAKAWVVLQESMHPGRKNRRHFLPFPKGRQAQPEEKAGKFRKTINNKHCLGENNMATVGVVKALNGEVTATDPRGNIRVLKVGDRVADNEIIKSGTGSNVHIDFNNKGFVTLGSGDSIQLDRGTMSDIASAGKQSAAPKPDIGAASDAEVEKLQQQIEEALAKGEDPTSLLEAAAAGGAAAGGGGAQEGGTFVVVEQNAARGDLTPGFETGTFNIEFTDPVEYDGRGPLPEITITPTFVMDDGSLRVDESRMPGGTKHETGQSTPTYEVTYAITTNNGLVSITIAGKIYNVVNGELVGFPAEGIAGSNGVLKNGELADNGGGNYTLSFDYEQTRPEKHDVAGEGEAGRDIADNVDSWEIIATGTGASASSTLTVDIVDDVPTIKAAEGQLPSLSAIVDESALAAGNHETEYGTKAVLTGEVINAQFDVKYGYDGKGTDDTYSLKLNGDNVDSGLKAMAADGSEVAIFMSQEGNVITGSTADGTPYFTITLGADGSVTFELLKPVAHPDKGATDAAHDDSVTLQLDEGVLLLTKTVTDNDGDTASASIDLGAVGAAFTVKDDGPSMTMKWGGDKPTLTTEDARTVGADSHEVSAEFGKFILDLATPSYGGDGAGTTVVGDFKLLIKFFPTGLTSGGKAISVARDGDTLADDVVGKTEDGTIVFRVSVDPDTGKVTLTQYEAIDHGADGNDHDAIKALGNDCIALAATITVTDNDGDTATQGVEIGLGNSIRFQDHGPSVTLGAIAEGGITLVTKDAETIGENVSTATSETSEGKSAFAEAILAAATPNYGGDGAGTKTVGDFALTVDNTVSGLKSGGKDIVLSKGTDGVVYGKVGDTVIFEVSVNKDTGEVTLTQRGPIDHGSDNNDHSAILSLDGGKITLEATVTVTDRDGDTD